MAPASKGIEAVRNHELRYFDNGRASGIGLIEDSNGQGHKFLGDGVQSQKAGFKLGASLLEGPVVTLDVVVPGVWR